VTMTDTKQGVCICDEFMVTIRAESGAKFKRPFSIWLLNGLKDGEFIVRFHGVDQDLERFDADQVQAIKNYVKDWRAQFADT